MKRDIEKKGILQPKLPIFHLTQASRHPQPHDEKNGPLSPEIVLRMEMFGGTESTAKSCVKTLSTDVFLPCFCAALKSYMNALEMDALRDDTWFSTRFGSTTFLSITTSLVTAIPSCFNGRLGLDIPLLSTLRPDQVSIVFTLVATGIIVQKSLYF